METSSSISSHSSLLISKINTHHSKLAQLSAEFALSFLEGKDELEIIEIVANGTDPVLPFDDVTTPREIYLPYAFEALRRDLVIGGACARQLGEDETQNLLDIIESAYEFHGLEVTRLVGGVWVVDSGEEEDDDEDEDEEGYGNGEDGGEEEVVDGELIIGLNFKP